VLFLEVFHVAAFAGDHSHDDLLTAGALDSESLGAFPEVVLEGGV